MIKNLLLFLVAVSICLEGSASVVPVADYKLTDQDALGQVLGPGQLTNSVGSKYTLARLGEPRYMNVAYDPAEGRALLFNGKSSYSPKRGIPGITDEFVMETWCRAAKQENARWHGVVAHGDGGRGILYCAAR